MKPLRNVLLISPPYTLRKGRLKSSIPPLGVAYLAGVLEKSGYSVTILDAAVEGFQSEMEVDENHFRYGLTFEEIGRRILEFEPDVVGVSCLFTPQYQNVREICRKAREVKENCIIVVGGEHPSVLPEECLSDDFVDYVVLGEGEYTFRDLLKAIEQGDDLSVIDGLAFRREGKIQVNPRTSFITDLDELPFPARHLLPMDKYFRINLPQGSTTSRRSPQTSMITSRGCSARCVFCATTKFWGNRFRARSAHSVLDEIQLLVEKYGVKEIHFGDDNITLDRERMMEICQGIIDRQLDVAWCCPQGVAVWTLDEELLKIMKRSGCYELTLGIESGDEEVLRTIIGKPLKLDMVRKIVPIMKKLGIEVDSFFVVGFPGETKEQIRKTLRFARELNVDRASFFIATPLPGTRLLKLCMEKGYCPPVIDWSDIDYSVGQISTEEFTSADVEKMIATQTFLFSLGLILRNPVEFVRRYVMFGLRYPKLLLNYLRFLLADRIFQKKKK